MCYLLVEIAAAWFVGAPKFVGVHGGQGKVLGLTLPLAGAVVIAVVLWFNVKDAETWTAAPLLGLYWSRGRSGDRTGRPRVSPNGSVNALTAELALTPPVEVR